MISGVTTIGIKGYAPDPYNIQGSLVLDTTSSLEIISFSESSLDDPIGIRTIVHELGHKVETNNGTPLSKTPNTTGITTEVISTLYGIKMAQIMGAVDMETAVLKATTQISLFNWILWGDVIAPVPQQPLAQVITTGRNFVTAVTPSISIVRQALEQRNKCRHKCHHSGLCKARP